MLPAGTVISRPFTVTFMALPHVNPLADARGSVQSRDREKANAQRPAPPGRTGLRACPQFITMCLRFPSRQIRLRRESPACARKIWSATSFPVASDVVMPSPSCPVARYRRGSAGARPDQRQLVRRRRAESRPRADRRQLRRSPACTPARAAACAPACDDRSAACSDAELPRRPDQQLPRLAAAAR